MTQITQTSVIQTAQRGIKGAIIAVIMAGVRRRNSGAVVNGALSFAAAYLPRFIEHRYNVAFRPWQRMYTATAMLTHAAGMLGLYDDTWWWDHLTHVLSASLLGGFVHVAAFRRGRDPNSRVLAAIVGGGVLWELMEYTIHGVTERLGLQPVLIPYSARDTLLDLVFDLVGALLVLVFGNRFLRNFIPNLD
jgi:hypothetical protein